MVFSGKGLGQLSEFQSNLYKRLTQEKDFKQAKCDKLKQRPLLASHVISIGMKRQETEKIRELEEIEAVACAVQNMYLTATSYGIGAFWSTGGVTYTEEAKSFFNLGDRDKLLGFLYLGYPKGDWPEGKRLPIGDKVKWVR